MSVGFRRFRITRKVPESAIITSFYLAPCDGEPVWVASPGQYLTLRIPLNGSSLLKTYSISTDVAKTGETRISVKRESTPVHLPYDCYLCGPTPFMVAMYRLLLTLGVPETRIGSRTPIALAKLVNLTNPDARAASDDVVSPSVRHSLPARTTVDDESAFPDDTDVVFVHSGVAVHWSDSAESLLELAEQSGAVDSNSNNNPKDAPRLDRSAITPASSGITRSKIYFQRDFRPVVFAAEKPHHTGRPHTVPDVQFSCIEMPHHWNLSCIRSRVGLVNRQDSHVNFVRSTVFG